MNLIERIQKEIKLEKPINSNSAKGIIEIKFAKGSSLWILDVKTPGYPIKKFVGSYVIKGGNWTEATDRSPLDTYTRELKEEFCPAIKEDKTEIDNVAWMVDALVRSATPLWDYLIYVPEKVHERLGKGPYVGVESYFSSELKGDELCGRLRIPIVEQDERISLLTHELGIRSTESKIAILSDKDIKKGVYRTFAFGDDQKFARFIKENKGFEPNLGLVEGIMIEELETKPITPYAERPFLKLLRINPTSGSVDDAAVYK